MEPSRAIQEVIALLKSGEPVRAAARAKVICQRDPRNFDAIHLGAVAQAQAGELPEAIALFHKALKLRNDVPDLYNNLGLALGRLGRLDEAIAHFRRALELQPNQFRAQLNLGSCLMQAHRYEDAVASFIRAAKLGPREPAAHASLGLALAALDRHQEACASYRRAVELRPDHAGTHHNLGLSYAALGHYTEAIACFRQALRINPEHAKSLGHLVSEMLAACDWHRFSKLEESLKKTARHPSATFSPLPLLLISDDPAEIMGAAEKFCEKQTGTTPVLDPVSPPSDAAKIRIAYLSADFGEHAVAYLMANVFERHNKERFETHAISFGLNEANAMRSRLQEAFDSWHDVHTLSDLAVTERMRALNIHIAVDLNGYTEGARPAILARRPAPVQVNYLGYPGTMGAPFMDYILVDEYVVPHNQKIYLSECPVWLPNCYLPFDGQREKPKEMPSRQNYGVPVNSFVFSAFHAAKKITPAVFSIWMNLLKQVDKSVLWLREAGPLAEGNLRREAMSRGIDPERLIFARWTSYPEYLARFGIADLFLDTFPYNAHTTASDALWMGLPLLTCSGKSIAARGGGSVLRAAGLPELITDHLADYEALALKLAAEPELLDAHRQTLKEKRNSAPLFDCTRFTRNLEAAYVTMYERWQNGNWPQAIAIEE